MTHHIELIARAVIICGDHALVCRHPPGTYLVFPGGHIEFGESAPGALAREIIEEIGLEMPIGPCLAIEEHVFEQKGRARHEYNLMFHVEHPSSWHPSSPPPLTSPEAPRVELLWLHRDVARQADLRPQGAKALLLALFEGRTMEGQPTTWISPSIQTGL